MLRPEQRLDIEARAETDPLDPDAPWTWTTLAQQTSHRHAADLYDRTGSLGRSLTLADEEWAAVGVLGRSARERCTRRDVMPSDFGSEDRNLRMSASAARGDLDFEGELVSDAYDLGNHSSNHAHVGRVVHSPAFIDTPDGRVAWNEAGYETQLAYIDGYASAVEAVAIARGRYAPG